MTDPTDPFERELRRSLGEHARDAPDAGPLTDRLLAAGAGPDRLPGRQRSWGSRGLPLVAAACVAAIVGVVIAIAQVGHGSGRPDAANTPTLALPATNNAAPPTAAPSLSSPPRSGAAASSPPTANSTLQDVRVLDLTFTGSDDGWALASASCLTGPGRCTALLRTTDGTTWQSHPNTPFDVPGVNGCPATKCVTHLRFATEDIGYAFGPDALFMTTDGAQHWTRLAGGAYALETLDGNVIRVVAQHSGCPGPCDARVETADLGSVTWTAVALPGGRVDAASLSLSRTGHDAFLETSLGQAGSLYAVSLFTSTDDGARWTKRADPCRAYGSPAVGTTVVSQSIAAAADGSVSALCAGTSGAHQLVVTSTDGGATFTAGAPVTGAAVTPSAAHGAGLGPIGAASDRVLVGYAAGGLYRSTDGGHTWRRVASDTSSGDVAAPGFESSKVGRWVSPDRRTIWTTRDAGRSWKAAHFS